MFSLNEISSTAKKAARGAGFSWGVSDEAGMAVRWLTSRGVDGCAALAILLQRVDTVDLATIKPEPNKGVWATNGPFLCPISTGCTVSDFGPATYDFRTVVAPILLLPFVSTWRGATLTMATGVAATNGKLIFLTGDCEVADADVRVTAELRETIPVPHVHRANPDPDSWQILLSFAHRTYAPATEESRRRGAG